MRLLLVGDEALLEPLAGMLSAEGMHASCVETHALPVDLIAHFRDFDAILVEDTPRAASLFDVLRRDVSPVLRVLMVGDGGIRQRGDEQRYELLFPRKWTRPEARILCAWVRSSTRRAAMSSR